MNRSVIAYWAPSSRKPTKRDSDQALSALQGFQHSFRAAIQERDCSRSKKPLETVSPVGENRIGMEITMASSFEVNLKGHFIVLEGIDGSGTTTQARRLLEKFTKYEMPAWFTCEPTDGPIGKQIRRMLTKELKLETWRAEALLFAADRAEHVRQIQDVLKGGTHVVCDRYDLSNYTYQQLSRPDDPFYPAKDAYMERQRILKMLNDPNPRPDLTLVLDIPANVAELRRGAREEAPEIYDVPQLQRRLAAMYARAESLLPNDRVVHVDASRDVEEVHKAVWEAYEQHVQLLRIREAAPVPHGTGSCPKT